MEPANFDEANLTLGPPPGMTETEVQSLRVWRGVTGNDEAEKQAPVVVSCWRVSAEELAEITKTGRVWLHVYGRTMPPVWVEGLSPFRSLPGGPSA